MIIVDKNGTGQYEKIQDAIDNLCEIEELQTIYIKKGVYKERIVLKKRNVNLIGEDAEKTIITYDLGAFEILDDGIRRGTFRTATMLINTNNVRIEGITIQNSAGLGRDVGQAIALYAEGHEILIKDCKLLGSQDTLFTGPLPHHEYEKGGFVGPTEFAHRINGLQIYENCLIRGDIDFIFGSASAYFKRCEIFSQDIEQYPNGYIVAPSTATGQKYGYVFDNCNFTSNAPNGTVYLGRPWRHDAKTVLVECNIGPHIHPSGFDDWGKTESYDRFEFIEYNCMGLGAKLDCRISFVQTDLNKKNYTLEKI
ncbi:MAG: pectinesterase family protein, partial [Erysipelotrichaceae bacterium]